MRVTAGNVKYPDKFKVGDIAIAKHYIRFNDNTYHQVGQEIVVTEQNVSYYNVCQESYDKKDLTSGQS